MFLCSYYQKKYGRTDAMYEVRADAAPVEVRTHEDGHVPSRLQPLQVALLRKALPRPPHPPRTGRPSPPTVAPRKK